MSDRDELEALRRLAELEAKAGGTPAPARSMGPPEELNVGERLMSGVTLPGWMQALSDGRDRLRGTAVEGVAKGMLNPFVGAVQAVGNALPDATGIPQAMNESVQARERNYQQARAAQGREGIDAAELVGEVASPVNLALAMKLPAAAVRGWQAARMGAGIGAAGAALQPVTEDGDYWKRKGGQAVAGAAVGAVLTPALGKVADLAARKLAADGADVVGARAAIHTDDAIRAALAETGQSATDLPPSQLEALRAEVLNAMKGGQKIDAAARLRKADFDALNMEPTLGQITRDPNQYAKEKNLQSIGGIGDELTTRFNAQNRQLAKVVGTPAEGAQDAYTAGARLIGSLKNTDDILGRHVSGLYREARAVAPDAGQVPLQGLAQDAADILRRYEGVPALKGIRNILEDFGALGDGMRQQRVFGYDDAEALLKQINKLGGDKTTLAAASELRESVKRAITESAGGAGPYDAARKAAAQRFSLQDAVPALKAAADGSVAPDDFVRRFIVGGKTDDVRQLGQVLKASDLPAWNEARAQIADALKRAAFGENAAGDAPFRSATYMQEIRRIGPQKLAAFFDAKEVEDILRVGRVGAYMRSFPSDAPVNTSRTAGTALWMASKVPGGNALASLGQAAARTVQGGADARRALAAEVPVMAADLTERQRNLLAIILAGGGLGAGALAGSAAGQ